MKFATNLRKSNATASLISAWDNYASAIKRSPPAAAAVKPRRAASPVSPNPRRVPKTNLPFPKRKTAASSDGSSARAAGNQLSDMVRLRGLDTPYANDAHRSREIHVPLELHYVNSPHAA